MSNTVEQPKLFLAVIDNIDHLNTVWKFFYSDLKNGKKKGEKRCIELCMQKVFLITQKTICEIAGIQPICRAL